ncbi:MAG: FAD-dependent oxidoreductase [Candidatus Entotheonellia bacterium]
MAEQFDVVILGSGSTAFAAALTVQEFRVERILIATGRRPNTDTIGIERAGVSVNARGEVEVDAFLRTNVSHIFAAGDGIGGETVSQMATPVGSRDGGIAAHNALSGGPLRRVDHRVIPRVIFTDPQAAVVGLTEEAAVALHFRARLQDFIDPLHVYPTMAEALKLAAISRFRDPRKLSCCAE